MTITIAQLIAAGFVEEKHEGQEGVFYAKRQAACKMPYVNEHMVDNELFWPESEVLVEVTPDRQVQMFVASAGYYEGPCPLDSEDAMGLLKDAGFSAT